MDDIEKIDLAKVDWKSSREFFESLGDALDKLDDKDESYNFTWVGKRKSIIEAGTPINKTLRPDVEASKDFDNTKNMLIIGDNLDALKLLQESYLGKIKMIYIDPPYNTGHDFVYHDNFTINKEDFKKATTDSDNILISEDKYVENSKANGRFHSDWLSMMYPRLKLARNLLSEDGIIFISIDDNEHANLKKICDEVFGQDNFVATFVWEKNFRPVNESKTVRGNSEYIICYFRNNESTLTGRLYDTQGDFSLTKKNHTEQTLKFPANRVLASFDDGVYSAGDYGAGYVLLNDIIVKDGIITNDFAITVKMSIWSQGHLDDEIAKGCRVVIKNPKTMVVSVRKIYQQSELKPTTLLPSKEIGDVLEANAELANIFGEKGLFDYPKPTSLLKFLISVCPNLSDGDIIMDFFAGSGTMGDSVMQYSVANNISLKYILVQYPEDLDDNLRTANNEAKNTIEKEISFLDGIGKKHMLSEITAERLRRAGNIVAKNANVNKYDFGFREFNIDSSNEDEDIRRALGDIKQTDFLDAIDNIKNDRTPLDLLFGVVCASALPLDLKLEKRKVGENIIYLYGYLGKDSGLAACFDKNIPEETIKEMAKLGALTVAFRDDSFEGSAVKINLSEQFRVISPETKVKVI